MVKKLISAVLGIAAAASLIQFPVSAEESKGYYWMEAEDAVCSAEYKEITNADAAGGKLMGLYELEESDYTVEFSFDNEKADKYDIWFLSGPANENKISKFKWSINGSEPVDYSSAGANAGPVYSDESLNECLCGIQWNKIASAKTMTAGENNIKFIVSSKTRLRTEAGDRACFNMIDAAVAVPSSWKWTPDGLNLPEEPVVVPSDFIWLELESPDNPPSVLKTKSNSKASGGELLYANAIAAGDITSETMSYSFEVDKAKNYDIWYLGYQTNVAHLSSMEWDIDNPSPSTPNKVNPEEDNPTCYSEYAAGSNFPMYWQKMSTKKMEAGSHTLYMKFNGRQLDSNYILAADCVMLVPTEFNWMPNELNLLPASAKGEFVARMFKNKYADYFNKDFTCVTEDIELPETKNFPNQLDASITYSADMYDRREVIDGSGRITRPYSTAEGDAVINLYINAEYTDTDGTKQIGRVAVPVTVKKWNKYEILEELTTNKTELTAGETITAAAKVNVHVGGINSGTATILMVLYDASGRMLQISMGEAKGSGEICPEAQMTLPQNVTGTTLKVFMINGLENGNRLADAITING